MATTYLNSYSSTLIAQSSKSNAGSVAAGAIVAAIVLIAIFVFVIIKRKRNKKQESDKIAFSNTEATVEIKSL